MLVTDNGHNDYFDYGEKLKDPQFEPHAGIKMVQDLGSLVYICDAHPSAANVAISSADISTS